VPGHSNPVGLTAQRVRLTRGGRALAFRISSRLPGRRRVQPPLGSFADRYSQTSF